MEPDCLGSAACTILRTAPALEKANKTRRLARRWQSGRLAFRFADLPPDTPARPARPALLPPRQMAKRGKAGSARSQAALFHALAHIEFNAIDLAWDAVARFGPSMPRAFSDDWVQVAADEAKHFLWLRAHLRRMDCDYGDLPAHDGLWQSAAATDHCLIARLSVVPLVLEARALDVTTQTVARLKKAGDARGAQILQRIACDEIAHVSAGQRWLRHACESAGVNAAAAFQASVRRHFAGRIKPPFNNLARLLAGFSPTFYLPLAS